MTTSDVTCRIRVRVPDDKNDEGRLVGISERSGASDEVRKQWVEGITEYIWGSQSNKGARQCIRPWDFLLVSDGSVESLPAAKIEGDISSGMYPAHYRIPPVSIEYLDQQGQIDRQERFAFASLLYEIVSGKKPFERLSSEEVQQRYSNADFPDDVRNLPPAILIAILSFWSLEFSNLGILHPCINLQRFLTAASHLSSLPLLPHRCRSQVLHQSTPVSVRSPTHRRCSLRRRLSCSHNSRGRRLRCVWSCCRQRGGRMAGFHRYRGGGKHLCLVPERGHGRSSDQHDHCYGCSGWWSCRSYNRGSSSSAERDHRC